MTKNYLRTTSRTALAAIFATGLCYLAPAHAATAATSKSNLSANDKKFVEKAYRGGLEEVANARIAKGKAKNEATKVVAERMTTDHSKANDRLRAIATEEHLDVSGIHPQSMNLSGDNFDNEYLTMLQKVHKKDIAMFEKEASDTKPGEDRDVPAFAKKTLPILKEHLQMIDNALATEK